MSSLTDDKDALLKELSEKMSLDRLAKTGLFTKIRSEGDEDYRKELYLHRAVLDRALIDTFYPETATYKDDNGQPVFIRKEVDAWLEVDNPDFIEACERAALEPKMVFAVFMFMKRILVGEKAQFKKLGPRKLY